MFKVVCGCSKLQGRCALFSHAMNLAEWHGERTGHWGRIVVWPEDEAWFYRVYQGCVVRTYRHDEQVERSETLAYTRRQTKRPNKRAGAKANTLHPSAHGTDAGEAA